MKIPRRQFLHLAAGAAALPALSRAASAQAYPTRPITMVVSFAAGGPADAVGRIIVERIRSSLRQPVVIENVTGADGSIAGGRASRAKPDGYTIDLGSISTHVLNGAFYSLPYDVFERFCACLAVGLDCEFSLCKEDHGGNQFAGIDRFVESKSRPRIDGGRQRQLSPPGRVV
jgi:tripartite-type tricarboxylate transporter receptor subunit TctC